MAQKESAAQRHSVEEYVARLLAPPRNTQWGWGDTKASSPIGAIPCTKYARKILSGDRILAMIEHHSDGTYKLRDDYTPQVKLSADGERLFQIMDWYLQQQPALDRFIFQPELESLIDIARTTPEIFFRQALGLQLHDGTFVFQLLNTCIHALRKATKKKAYTSLVSQWKHDVRGWQVGIVDYLESLIKKHSDIWSLRLEFYAPQGESEHHPILSLRSDLIEEFKSNPALKEVAGHVMKLDWNERFALDVVLIFNNKIAATSRFQSEIAPALEAFAKTKNVFINFSFPREKQFGLGRTQAGNDHALDAMSAIAKSFALPESFLRLKLPEGWAHTTSIILGEGELAPAQFSPQAPSQQCPLTKEYREQIHHFLEDQQRTIDQNTQKEIVKQNLGKKIAPIQNSSFAPEKEKSPFGEYAKDRSYPPKAKKP